MEAPLLTTHYLHLILSFTFIVCGTYMEVKGQLICGSWFSSSTLLVLEWNTGQQAEIKQFFPLSHLTSPSLCMDAHKPPKAGVVGGCELPSVGAGNQTLALTTESSLQPHTYDLLSFFYFFLDKVS